MDYGSQKMKAERPHYEPKKTVKETKKLRFEAVKSGGKENRQRGAWILTT